MESDLFVLKPVVDLVDNSILNLENAMNQIKNYKIQLKNENINFSDININNNDINDDLVLDKILIFSKKSIIDSENSFFHPSLTSLLYFAIDQKAAVYLPLIAPILYSVLFSLISTIKTFLKKKIKN
jgi:hypothetical protein